MPILDATVVVRRYRRGMPPKPVSLEQRFWPKVDRTADCWLWTASTNGVGYGKIISEGGRESGRLLLAHRVAYELVIGPIPPGKVLDHICCVRRCVNPAHLRPTTIAENSDVPGSVAHENRRKTHCPRGHELAGANLIRSRGSRQCRRCENRRQRERKSRQSSVALTLSS